MDRDGFILSVKSKKLIRNLLYHCKSDSKVEDLSFEEINKWMIYAYNQFGNLYSKFSGSLSLKPIAKFEQSDANIFKIPTWVDGISKIGCTKDFKVYSGYPTKDFKHLIEYKSNDHVDLIPFLAPYHRFYLVSEDNEIVLYTFFAAPKLRQQSFDETIGHGLKVGRLFYYGGSVIRIK